MKEIYSQFNVWMSHLLSKHFHSRVWHSTWHIVGAQCKCLWREGMISLLRTRSYSWYVIRGTFSKTHWFSDKCKYYWPMGNAVSRLQVQSMQQECVPSFYSVPIPMRAEQQKGRGRCGCWLQSYNLSAEAELINRQWEEKDSRGSDHNSGSNQQVYTWWKKAELHTPNGSPTHGAPFRYSPPTVSVLSLEYSEKYCQNQLSFRQDRSRADMESQLEMTWVLNHGLYLDALCDHPTPAKHTNNECLELVWKLSSRI